MLQARRDCALKLIQGIPRIRCGLPQGAFYLYPDVSGLLGRQARGRHITDVDVLAEMLLTEAHAAVVAGSAFGSPHHLRLSYAVATEQVEQGLQRIRQFVEGLE